MSKHDTTSNPDRFDHFANRRDGPSHPGTVAAHLHSNHPEPSVANENDSLSEKAVASASGLSSYQSVSPGESSLARHPNLGGNASAEELQRF